MKTYVVLQTESKTTNTHILFVCQMVIHWLIRLCQPDILPKLLEENHEIEKYVIQCDIWIIQIRLLHPWGLFFGSMFYYCAVWARLTGLAYRTRYIAARGVWVTGNIDLSTRDSYFFLTDDLFASLSVSSLSVLPCNVTFLGKVVPK